MPSDMCNHNEGHRALDCRRRQSGEVHHEKGVEGVNRKRRFRWCVCPYIEAGVHRYVNRRV